MIASLLRQMGLQLEAALYPDSSLILDIDQHTFNVFHVEQAHGSPSIPAQADFVKQYGIRSALGFGGLFSGGELFTVIMFSRVTIPRETADMFRTIALCVKLALLPFARGPVFESEASNGNLAKKEQQSLRSEIATFRLLISALEEAALHQTKRLKLPMASFRNKENWRNSRARGKSPGHEKTNGCSRKANEDFVSHWRQGKWAPGSGT